MGTKKEAKLWINTKKMRNKKISCMDAVSYTHLKLPTILLV